MVETTLAGYALAGTAGLFLIATCWSIFVGLRKKVSKPMLNLIGLRGTMPGRLWHRRVQPVRGMYTWKEKGDFEADLYLDPDFIKTGSNGETYMHVDLDAWLPIAYKGKGDAPAAGDVSLEHDGCQVLQVAQPITFNGACENDNETVTLTSKRHGTVIIPDIWRRLSGVRLAQIRKDRRIFQLNRTLAGWAEVLQKALPWLVVLCVVLLIVILVFLVKAA